MLKYADGEWIRRDGALYGRGRGGVSAGRPRLARADTSGGRGARRGGWLAAHHLGALAVLCGDALTRLRVGRRSRARVAGVATGGARSRAQPWGRDRGGGRPSFLRADRAAAHGRGSQPARGGGDGLGSEDTGYLRTARPRCGP